MATNILPTNSAQLIGLAQKMIAGVTKIGAAIPVTMVTAAGMKADLDAFILQDGDFNAARSARKEFSDAYQETTDAVYGWLLAVSNMLATPFGTRWSTAWAQAGFVNHSTAIPTKIEERLGLALALVKFFTKNPGYEVESMNLTAAHGKTLRDAALKAQDDVATAAVALNEIGDAWQKADDKLVGVMRELIKNLEGKLKRSDPRWLAFGLNMPATSSTPGKPLNLTALSDETGAIVVQCDAVPLAARYRWRMLIVGVQTEYQLAASTTEPLASISDVKAGQTVQIIVQAVNGNSQGVASEPVDFTLPPARTAGFSNRATAEEAPAAGEDSNVHRSGNGNGNGHARHARVA